MRNLFLFFMIFINTVLYSSGLCDTTFANYYNKAIETKKNGDFQRSIEILDSSRKYCSSRKDSIGLYNILGTSYIWLGDFFTAKAYIDSACAISDSTYLGYLYINYGIIFSNLGEDSKAINYYKSALELIDKNRLGLVYYNLAKCFYYNNSDSAKYYYTLAYNTKIDNLGLDNYSTLITGLELAEFKPYILEEIKPYILERKNNILLGFYYSLTNDFEKAEYHLKANPSLLLRLYTKYSKWDKAISMIDTLRGDYLNLEGKLFLAKNERVIYKNAIEKYIQSDTLKAFKYALKSRANLLKEQIDVNNSLYPNSLNYFDFDSIIYLFHIHNKIDFYKIDADSLFWANVYNFIMQFSERKLKQNYKEGYKEFCERGVYLYKKLLPFNIQEKDLLLIPDNRLHYIPFDCLPTCFPDDTSIVDYSKIDYLLCNYNIHYDYLLRKHEQSHKVKHIYAFAPEQRLEYSYKEVKYLKRKFGAKIFKGKKAKLNEILNGEILHIAMSYTPKEEVLQFADKGLNIDSIPDLPKDMVVLATCFSGLGVRHDGEGVFSPGYAFYKARAKCVIESIWKSNDYSSFEIYKEFYNQLKNNKNKSEALRLAKLKFIENNIGPLQHPFYWGNLRCFGNDTPIRISSNRRKLIFVFMGIIITVIIIKYFFRPN